MTSFQKFFLIFLLFVAVFLGLIYWLSTVIGESIGPALPEFRSRKYLEAKGASPALISNLIELNPLTIDDFNYLAEQNNVNVRHLVARNPHLTREQRQRFQTDPNEFVRSGAAGNRSITLEEINRMLTAPLKESYYVFAGFSSNPAVPPEILLKIFHMPEKPDFFSFAYHPQCPEEIKAAIRASDDEYAKEALKRKEEERAKTARPPTEKDTP